MSRQLDVDDQMSETGSRLPRGRLCTVDAWRVLTRRRASETRCRSVTTPNSVRGDEEQTVAFLAQLAAGRDALELAVGTGRIAVPLAATGVRVDGIEISQDMVDRMRDKPGGTNVEVTIGDMSRVSTGRRYGLVYLVFNTIGNLLTQDDQVRCFQNAADHLTDDGVFVLECRCPDRTHTTRSPVRRRRACRGRPRDARRLPIRPHHTDSRREPRRISTDGVVLNPIRLRLAQAPEFDLMARLAGLTLRDRWGGWNGEPFDATSRRHISVYARGRVELR